MTILVWFRLKTTDSTDPLDDYITRLVAGEEISISQAYRLFQSAYPEVERWCTNHGVPKENRSAVIGTIVEAIRTATVKIELPTEIVEYVKRPHPAATR